MEAGCPTNFTPNITAPNSKYLTYYQLNKGTPFAGQITPFKSLIQVFFSVLKTVLVLALIGEQTCRY